MAWPFWLLAGLLWLTLWMGIFARAAAAKDGDALAPLFGSLLPVFCAATCLAAFLAVPARSAAFHKINLWAHHTSVLLLFLFLLAAQYFQAEAWWRRRRGEKSALVAGSYRRLWLLTEILPAPIALTILLTGLRLIWEAPRANSPARLWLFGMVAGFSFFFWDGILGYRPIVRRMWRECGPPAAVDALQLLLHCLSWPLVFVLGLFRWDAAMPLTRMVSLAVARLDVLPFGWPEVVVAALIWACAGAATIFARRVLARGRS